MAAAPFAFPFSLAADLFPNLTFSLTTVYLFLVSAVVVLILGFAAFFFEYVRRIGCEHLLEMATVSDALFEDPNSVRKVSSPSIRDPAEKLMSLIIPAYNEEHRLSGTLEETLNYLEHRSNVDKSFTYEIIIVDDGSTDRTSKVAFDYVRRYKIDKVRVILLRKNRGKGEAVRQGMLHSRGELLLMLDADGATKLTDLEKLESQVHEFARKSQADRASSNASSHNLSGIEIAVFGSRAHLEKQAVATRKWYRNLLMKGFHLVVLLTAGSGIRDTQCGFKMFSRSAAKKLFMNIRLKRWCFDVEIVYLCKRLRIPMFEVSVNWTEIPGSKVRFTSILHMLFEMLLIKVGYGLGLWKVHSW